MKKALRWECVGLRWRDISLLRNFSGPTWFARKKKGGHIDRLFCNLCVED
jgi:hypothetical protein